MSENRDPVEHYYTTIYHKIVALAPVVGTCAAITFTVARLFGHFPGTNLAALIGFDVISIGYILVAVFFKIHPHENNGVVDPAVFHTAKIVLGVLTLLQWNLISYIFPSRDFWGYASLFVLLSAFFFDAQSVLTIEIGLSISIAVSWIIMGDKLLPVRDTAFGGNLLLRIIALFFTFFVLYLQTRSGELFKKQVIANTEEMRRRNAELKNLNLDIINFTADILEQRNMETGLHGKRVRKYSHDIAEEVRLNCPRYGLTPEDVERITDASVLHDVGKIYIPDSILLKEGPLTKEEFDVIKTHPLYSADVISKMPKNLGEDFLHCCTEIGLYHHERVDGSGYPNGLKGDQIPVSAMITSLADCFDALTSERPYKKAYDEQTAAAMILRGECGAFPEDILDCFRTVVTRYFDRQD